MKKKNVRISEISWYYVPQRAGSGFCATNNFQGTFAHFGFLIFTQGKQTRMLIHVRIKSSTEEFLSNAVVNVLCNC